MRARFLVLLLSAALCCFAQPFQGGKRAQGQKRTAVDRWNGMSPEDRERALQRLPPERRKRLQTQIERYNNMPDEERGRLRRHYDQFQRMPPEKQARARELFKELSELSPERRRTLRRETEALRALSESGRNARFESESFKTRFSEPEQKLIRRLGNLAISEPQ
ncbi:MAG: DUF3106 domain-containing protein [Bryobacterales bacterium]|nr:DUF3106 domain-containing protein [Bryobacterales bacterium]